jgi:thiamine-phosphate pyrophosphorylase
MSRSERAFHGLHVLVDDDPRWQRDPVEQAEAAFAGGARVVQLRVKHASDRCALVWGRAVSERARQVGARFVVNDRFDLALGCDADAVHLGQTDLPPDALPGTIRQRLAIGRSTHDRAEARKSRSEPVAYVAFGPVYGTASKESQHDPRGLAMLRDVAGIVAPRPLIAIGGIDAQRVPELLRAGADGVAVISAVAAAPDPEAATRELVRKISAATAEASET